MLDEDGVVELAARHAAEGPVTAVGDGAIKLSGQLEAAGLTVCAVDDPRHVVGAAAIAELARSLAPIAINDVVPNYIREPDAKVSSRERWIGAGAGEANA